MDPETLTFSVATTAKAERLIRSGAVSRVPGQRDLWQVEGDHGTYRVRYDKDYEATGNVGFLVCTCPLSEHHTGLIAYCSHALAVLKTTQPDHAALIGAHA
jgi:uncharacterized Zn finger protein